MPFVPVVPVVPEQSFDLVEVAFGEHLHFDSFRLAAISVWLVAFAVFHLAAISVWLVAACWCWSNYSFAVHAVHDH